MSGRLPPPPSRTRSPRGASAFAVLISACCALVPVAMELRGRAARGSSSPAEGGIPEVLLLRTDAEVVRAWRSRGLRGRTVVHAGRFLHFVGADGAGLLDRTLTAPGAGATLDPLLEAQATPASYLWVAFQLRVARRLFFVSPPKALADRLRSLDQDDSALPLQIDAEAAPRALDRSAPHLAEPVLLDVNASWFDEADGEALLAGVRAARLRVELVTVTLAEDADDVSPAARVAARAFAAALAGRRLGGGGGAP